MVRSFLLCLMLGLLMMVCIFSGCHKAPKSESQMRPAPTPEVVPEYIPAPEPPSWEPQQPAQPRSVDVIVSESKSILLDVHFEYDRFDLSSETRRTLVQIADWLMKNPGVKIMIEGHCDERGSNEYNLALGERRAKNCESYLVTLGIDSANLSSISYGEERPIDPGHNEIAWAKNRRCHFKLMLY
ncbi:MAG: peptidoglycan-associated lipoprotein [Candidatus Schekmanbacteria bacterium RBG_13_48_7]|uniref:Peptidoglycan-associated lipoprotein n=1 Tax=Candidatus Schekmanbacteria bacterium RBG_13_48_7 TaxID=1817878 RepID=A0A1F7S6J0_9BACT|nr:MAG: peptidoglycan-associated lipoprotein [Candidatus Schekmanbacteria bacterium RBG_13_48_7]